MLTSLTKFGVTSNKVPFDCVRLMDAPEFGQSTFLYLLVVPGFKNPSALSGPSISEKVDNKPQVYPALIKLTGPSGVVTETVGSNLAEVVKTDSFTFKVRSTAATLSLIGVVDGISNCTVGVPELVRVTFASPY